MQERMQTIHRPKTNGTTTGATTAEKKEQNEYCETKLKAEYEQKHTTAITTISSNSRNHNNTNNTYTHTR